jgi:hypothetical protein
MRKTRTAIGALAAGAAAICLSAPAASASYDFSFSDFTVLDNSQSRSGIGCAGDNAFAISGGAIGGGTYADGTYVSESTPGIPGPGPNQGWTGQIDNYVGGAGSNLAHTTLTCDENGEGDYQRLHREDGVSVPDDRLGGGTLRCDGGATVVGGGNDTALNASLEDETYLSMSAPVDARDKDKLPDDGWRVEINNDEDPNALTTYSNLYAICDKKRNPSDYRYVTNTARVPDGSQRVARAKCLRDEKAISGGVEVKAPYAASMLVNSTFRAELGERTGWVAIVDNYTTPDGKKRKFTATAICLR